MFDRLLLSQNETADIDTKNNTAVILVLAGSAQIYQNTVLKATLGVEEIYTLPIESGVYELKATSDNTKVYIFRVFVY